MEPTIGIEPMNLILTKDVLYLLSYVGRKSAPPTERTNRLTTLYSFPFRPRFKTGAFTGTTLLERETGFEPATLSLEG